MKKMMRAISAGKDSILPIQSNARISEVAETCRSIFDLSKDSIDFFINVYLQLIGIKWIFNFQKNRVEGMEQSILHDSSCTPFVE